MDAWVWIVIAIAAVVLLALIAFALDRRMRRRRLQRRFGPEYDRAVESAERRGHAESDLADRARRRDELDIYPLSEGSRNRYGTQWIALQTHFVDRPQSAVVEAEELVTTIMRERGYPVDDFESQADLVSVDHPDVVENYRDAHRIYAMQTSGKATTEDLRRAVVSYRALFDELLGDGPRPVSHN